MGCLKLHTYTHLGIAHTSSTEHSREKKSDAGRYQYKYNGKELQTELGLNMYDYGARNYDPALGRWMNMDPLAELYYNHTTYNYVGSNPVTRTDPDGMDWYTDKDGNYTFDPDLTEENAEMFFKSKGYENAKYAFKSATVRSGINFNKETGEFEELKTSHTLNADGTIKDNITKEDVESGSLAETATGTKMKAYDENNYTDFSEWAKLSGESDYSGMGDGLKALGIGAAMERATVKKITKNPWYLGLVFVFTSYQTQTANLEKWENSLSEREKKALKKRREEINKMMIEYYGEQGGRE